MDALDSFVASIIAEHKHPLLFVPAMGNESLDLCASESAPPNADGKLVVSWPQNRGGRGPGPYLFVGATEAYASGGRVAQRFAPYSNFGSCVGLLAPGGRTCAWRVESQNGGPRFALTQGTSFAAPAVAGLLAMALAARPSGRGAEGAAAAVAALQGNQTAVADVPSGTPRAFAELPLSMAGPLTPAQPAPALPDPEAVAPKETLAPPPASEPAPGLTSLLTWLSAAAAVLFAVAILGTGTVVAVAAFVLGALVGAAALFVLLLALATR
jgi:hypothetical protein